MKTIFVGRVGKDPVVGEKDGKKWAAFSVAETIRKETVWHNVSVFGYLCDFVEEWVKQGSVLFIDGTYNGLNEYEGNYTIQVIANSINFVPTTKNGSKSEKSEKSEKSGKSGKFNKSGGSNFKSKQKPKSKPKQEEEEEEEGDDWDDE